MIAAVRFKGPVRPLRYIVSTTLNPSSRRAFSSSRPLSTGAGHVADVVNSREAGGIIAGSATDVASTSSGFIQTCSESLLSVPIASSSLSYSAAIVLLTLSFRLGITLPVTLWQRRRIKRVAENVVPEVKAWGEKAKLKLRAEFRRADKGYDAYVKELNSRTKAHFKTLTAKYKCRTLPTMLVPPMIHLPIFITMTIILRDTCIRSYQALQTMGEAASQLHDTTSSLIASKAAFAMESFAWCPSLADMDPYNVLPLAVGLSALTNVEIQFKKREVLSALQEGTAGNKSVISTSSGAPRAVQQARPTPVARPSMTARPVLPKTIRTYVSSTPASAAMASSGAVADSAASDPPVLSRSALTSKVITNTLRVMSVVFVPIAAFAPVAVNLYWITTNLFSISQNLILGRIDRQAARAKLLER